MCNSKEYWAICKTGSREVLLTESKFHNKGLPDRTVTICHAGESCPLWYKCSFSDEGDCTIIPNIIKKQGLK